MTGGNLPDYGLHFETPARIVSEGEYPAHYCVLCSAGKYSHPIAPDLIVNDQNEISSGTDGTNSEKGRDKRPFRRVRTDINSRIKI